MPSVRTDVREQLLRAAIEVFGQHGYEASSTRMLAKAAGANLQTIAYHFGGKEGLYLAAAECIGERMGARLRPLLAEARARLLPSTDAAEARRLLAELLHGMVGVLFSADQQSFARFVGREQMEPTAAFERIYRPFMKPMLGVLHSAVAIILEDEPESEWVRLRTLSLVGSLVFLRIARGTVMRQLGWRRPTTRQLDAVHELVRELVAALAPRGKR